MKIIQLMRQHWLITTFIVLGILYLAFIIPSAGVALSSGNGKENQVMNKDVYYQVLGTKETNEIQGPITKMKTDNRFLILTVNAVNQNKESVQLTTDMFRLIDDRKREYEINTKGNFFMNQDLGFFMQDLSPGLEKKGNLVFEVPKDARNLKLEIISKSMFKDSVKEIPLKDIKQ